MIEASAIESFEAWHRLARRAGESWLEAARTTTDAGCAYWHRAAGMPHSVVRQADELFRWLWLSSNRRPPGWSTPNKVVTRSAVSVLRDFSVERPRSGTPVLLLPPQAGNHSSIVDFSPELSQVSVALEAGLDRLYVLEWLGATPETRDSSIEDYVDAVDGAVAAAGGAVHLVGDCQGGWLGALYAALRPHAVASLTVAGAPVDFHAGDGALADVIRLLGADACLEACRAAVRAGGGLVRGDLLTQGFIALRPDIEWRRHLDLLLNLDDDAFVERYVRFEDWHKHPHDVAGAFFLWIVERLFLANELIRGTLRVGGEVVDLARIECPITMIAGTTDHMVPPAQVVALADHVSTPPGQVRRVCVEAGHLGLFVSDAVLVEHWLPAFRDLAAA